MRKFRNLSAILLFLISVTSVFSQKEKTSREMEKYMENILLFNYLTPREKVYLHFDNNSYYLGETIWFKAYTVVAEDNKLTHLSKVLYIEILTPEGKILETKKVKIENGQSHGEFTLDPYWKPGFYEIRAYTRSMLNWGEDFIFSRVFPIYDFPNIEGGYESREMTPVAINMRAPDQRPKKEKLKKVNATFYPEGGNLVLGLPSRIAFKVTDQYGKSLETEGRICDDRGNEVTSFRTLFRGMGTFELTPLNKKYTARINFENKEYSFDLPASLPEGVVLNVGNTGNEYVHLSIGKSIFFQADTLGICISSRGKLLYFQKINPEEKMIYSVPVTTFSIGVNQITLFNKAGNILAERLCYMPVCERLKITSSVASKNLSPYEEIEIQFSVQDTARKGVETVFSLAIQDAATSQRGNSPTILAQMLLASDIKGYIEDPEYYFEEEDETRRQALDLLLMVQGWSRYNWKEMAGIEPFEIKHPLEESLLVMGEVRSLFRKKKKENIDLSVWLHTDAGNSMRASAKTDENGRFYFSADDIYGKWYLTLSTSEKNKSKENWILLDRLFAPPPRSYNLQETRLSKRIYEESKEEFVEKLISVPDPVFYPDSFPEDSHLLPEVVIIEKKPKKKEDIGLNLSRFVYDFQLEADKMADAGKSFDDIHHFLWMLNDYFVIKTDTKALEGGGVKPVQFYLYKNRKLFFVWDNQGERKKDRNEELIKFERDTKFFRSTIKSIMISEKRGVAHRFGYIGYDDPIVIFIYTEESNAFKDTKGFRNTYFYGFTQAKEFYHPDYSQVILPDERDYRRTLYWDPNVKTDNEGKASVRFFNNSTCKQIVISAETITATGIPGVYSEE